MTRQSETPIGMRQLATSANWLLLLRWVAVAGQMVTIAFAHYGLGVDLPMLPLILVVAVTAASNLVFAVWVHRLNSQTSASMSARQRPIGLVLIMALDLVLLTALLYFAGGTTNPFTIFYLVNLTLCAVLLSERWGWLLTGVAVVGMLIVAVVHVDIPELANPAWSSPLLTEVTLEQLGRVVAMAACAWVIIHFVSRVTRQLEFTANELHRVERDRSRSEKLEALGTLAGGAAHELSTPLSTIAVVAKEMLRHLQDVDVPPSVREDAALIRSQVDQCQAILQRMTGRAGQWMVEQHVEISLQQLVDFTLGEVVQLERIDVYIAKGADQIWLDLPRESVAQALRGLLQNALDAADPIAHVEFLADYNDDLIQLDVRDDGPGMSDKVLQRAGEPFFTTKEPGRGMGLGLFLTRSVVERLNGTLSLDSTFGQGVTARVTLPRRPEDKSSEGTAS